MNLSIPPATFRRRSAGPHPCMRRSLRMAHALYARPPGGACPALRWPAECWGPAGLLSSGGGGPPPAGGGTHLRPAAVPTTRRSHVAASAAASSSAPAPTGSTGVAGDTLEATRAAFVAAWTAAAGQLRRQEAAPVPGWWTSRREWRLWVCQLECRNSDSPSRLRLKPA